MCEVISERRRRGYGKEVVYWSVNVGGGGIPRIGDWETALTNLSRNLNFKKSHESVESRIKVDYLLLKKQSYHHFLLSLQFTLMMTIPNLVPELYFSSYYYCFLILEDMALSSIGTSPLITANYDKLPCKINVSVIATARL